MDHWLGLPLFATQGKLPANVRVTVREQRLRNTPEALAACLRGMGTGAQPSFWDSLDDHPVPTLVMAGEEDEKFTQVATRMAERIPRSILRLVPKAGHAIHLENPFAWLAAVRTFDPDEASTRPRPPTTMKTIGLLGGMSWESTVTYYQLLNREIGRRLGGVHSARILLLSVDFQEIEASTASG